MSADLYLYKFRSINMYLVESIVNNSIYFAHPNNLNDPFDCQIDLKQAFSNAYKKANKDQQIFLQEYLDNENFMSNWNNKIGELGVFSFSLNQEKNLSAPLMWSHYANAHRGICIQYVIPETFLREKLMTDSDDFRLTLGGEVDYSEDGFLEFLLNTNLEMQEFIPKLLRKYLLKKSPSWSYENEGRLLLNRSCALQLPLGCIKEIHFGIMCSQSDRSLVTKLAGNYAQCHSFFELKRGASEHTLISQSIAT